MYLEANDVSYVFLIKTCVINIDFLDNKKGEKTAGVYLVSITEVITS